MNIAFLFKSRLQEEFVLVDKWNASSCVPQIGAEILLSGGREFTVIGIRFSGPEIVDVFVKPSNEVGGFQPA